MEIGDRKINDSALPAATALPQADQSAKPGVYSRLKNNIYKISTALLAVFFVAFFITRVFVWLDSRNGVISGVSEEAGVDMATTTVMEAGELLRYGN